MSTTIEERVARIMASRPTFRVGDRVRVRLSGECRARAGDGSVAGERGWTQHQDWEHGLVGTVDREVPGPTRFSQGHTLLVIFDHTPFDIRPARGASYAPTELELIAAGAPADEGAS